MFSDHVEPVLNKRKPSNGADMRQADIAAKLGIGCERVRQMEVAALRKLRQNLRERGIVAVEQLI
jgi:DNA-directed RNA polymerase sigma subunit (sigma70/sigma32)